MRFSLTQHGPAPRTARRRARSGQDQLHSGPRAADLRGPRRTNFSLPPTRVESKSISPARHPRGRRGMRPTGFEPVTFGFVDGPGTRLGYVGLGFKRPSRDRIRLRSAGLCVAPCPIPCPTSGEPGISSEPRESPLSRAYRLTSRESRTWILPSSVELAPFLAPRNCHSRLSTAQTEEWLPPPGPREIGERDRRWHISGLPCRAEPPPRMR
jgi:hypothetical protein